ncbi:TPA: aldo/keto reductase [bacterium]|nr:aldo/keto reductase [bacterium]
MQTRKLGTSDLLLTTVGFGTWGMSGAGWRGGWGPQDDNDSIEAIIKSYELGVNWIDTAPVYGLGHSEEVVGKALKELKERPIIATKLGLVWDDKGDISRSLKKESVKKEAEDSLRRMGIDVIDLYQIHWPIDDNMDEILEGWATMAELVKEGKVRYIGVSNFNIEQMEKIKEIHHPTSLQPPYNMTKRGVEKEILPYCGKNNIGIVCYSPMGKGILTGSFSRKRVENLSDDDHRKRTPDFQEPILSITLDMVETLKPIAEKYGRTLAQLAIAWVLRRSEVTSAIVGVRRPSQIEETAPAGDWVLQKDDIDKIQQILDEYDSKIASAPPVKSVL